MALMQADELIPVDGCWVRRRGDASRVGQVLGSRRSARGIEVKVWWGPDEATWEALAELASGLQPGWLVQDIPLTATRHPLGPGRVVASRRLGGREQTLVQLDETGQSVWLPYQHLRRVKDVQARYEAAEPKVPDHAQRFRLRLLAHALENWNTLTGSLDRLDVDPLPHQIQLVHRIISSGNYNWLIADDVGLGKTIEVGLLLAALKRKNQARRVLIIAPAGLTRQWQDEMRFKFGETYEIYERDFSINLAEHWKLHDRVIASLDQAKRDEHMAVFRAAGSWDVVIFDEGHKLTRHASGERAQRFRLAEALRHMTDALLLLSGTPHQGYADRFQALLELVRPDMASRIHTLDANPEIVRDMILRNRKSEVTDADGNFIFHGTQVHRVPVEPSATTQGFQKLLHTYLESGYRAGEGAGAVGRAIGFVMTTYRKLASSSIAAIERALHLRLERLTAETALAYPDCEDLSDEDLADGGDDQDDLDSRTAVTPAHEFFASERKMIEDLLDHARFVRADDEKLSMFIEKVVRPLVREGKKLLVFTEYRATQTYLQQALEDNFSDGVVLINGSMNIDEKLAAIDAFNTTARFLVSTEAGGEGLNLHRACHVMVNYDLPWNPARLIQRIGRLYRYGQLEIVTVINLHAHDSFDNTAVAMMLDRVMTIAREMAPVGTEFNDRLYADILGEVLENVDMASILKSTPVDRARTASQIDEAIARARRAQEMQDEIFRHVEGFAADAMQGSLTFTMDHVALFAREMIPLLGGSVVGTRHNNRVFDFRLPEDLRGAFPEFAQRTAISVTTDRRLAASLRDVLLLDFESAFFRRLIETAKSLEFEGIYSSVTTPAFGMGALAAFKLRWQNDQGAPLTEQFVTFYVGADGEAKCNPTFLGQWLGTPLEATAIPNQPREHRRAVYGRLLEAANRHLADNCSRFNHPNSLVHLAAADCFGSG